MIRNAHQGVEAREKAPGTAPSMITPRSREVAPDMSLRAVIHDVCIEPVIVFKCN